MADLKKQQRERDGAGFAGRVQTLVRRHGCSINKAMQLLRSGKSDQQIDAELGASR